MDPEIYIYNGNIDFEEVYYLQQIHQWFDILE
jgi:hypothetical protein